MAKQTLKIEGLKELEQALMELPKATGRNVVARALTKAGKPIVDAAKAKAPEDTGALRQSIQIIVRKRMRNPSLVYAVIGPAMGEYRQLKTPVAYVRGWRANAGVKRTYQVGGTPGVYGLFVEFGTIDTPAHPFMRPAWQANGGVALEIIQTELANEIEKARARLARKATRLAAKG